MMFPIKFKQLQFGLEELKFLRSIKDLKIYYQKIAYLLARSSEIPFQHSKVPPSIQIEPTNYCNVNCICCSAPRSRRAKGYMDYGLFQKIVDDASLIGVGRIHLYLHGEPMLHPKTIEMIGYIKSKNIGIHLTTNGILFDKVNIEAILHSGINSADHIRFSILGYSKKVHESIMKGVNHDKVEQNIFNFLELRKKHRINGPVIETIFYLMPENEQEKDQFMEYWSGKVDHATIVGRISKSFSEYKKGSIVIAPRVHTCVNLWERMSVFWNGDVTLCCIDVNGDYILGSLKEESIMKVWNCQQLLSIKKLHEEKQFRKFPFCANCDF